MVWNEVQDLKPKRCKACEDLSLAWNAGRQDAVKSGDAVCGNDEQAVAEVENLAHFSASQFRNSREVAFEKCHGKKSRAA
jgi:hypothetical protein